MAGYYVPLGRQQSGNALASTRNTGINNLLGAMGTGLKAYSTFKPR